MAEGISRVAVLGSTGSIGRSALEVIAAHPTRLRCVGLAARCSTAELESQAKQAKPQWIFVADDQAARQHSWAGLPTETRQLAGDEALERAVQANDVDIVLSAIVGSAGLRSTWAALEAGKTVALANKETLVVAGRLAMDLARDRGATILPVDSEHSAIFQAMQAGRRSEICRVILTASGGPFRNHSREQLEQATVAEAMAHPHWSMGRKITIDSATMMNKALELIEACWLFDLDEAQIEVVVHPQSIVHSMVEFVDGSVVAQLSPPDMKLPIQYALTYPDRLPGVAATMDWSQRHRLDFEPVNVERFPAIDLAREVARRGGTAGAVLNAANEAAVAGFLSGELRFTDIVPSCRAIVEQHHFEPSPSLDRLIELDRWARKEMARWVCT
ncbi:MAG TPA: 1-deoxy-D-xylulose-5-phosphate reductoisomerase [Pirellulales bacterium]|nr:1-deoxy-D-xylulose-5-phosphate reductoisomerase [Pirellulales bacterium]